jgi:hypothetical protein
VLSVAEAFQVSLLLWHQNASLSAEAFTTCSNKTIKGDAKVLSRKNMKVWWSVLRGIWEGGEFVLTTDDQGGEILTFGYQKFWNSVKNV